jgi:hypothetical protein
MILLHDIVWDAVGFHSSGLSVEALETTTKEAYRADSPHEMKLLVICP